MTYLGYRVTPSAGTVAIDHQKKMAWKFTTGLVAITPTSAHICVRGNEVTPAISFGIYTDNAGAPNALVTNSALTIAANATLAIDATSADDIWVGANYATSPTLAASTTYWLCAQCEGAALDALTLSNDVGATDQEAEQITDALPLAAAYGAVASYAAKVVGIYVEDDAGAMTTGRIIYPPENVIRHGG